MVIFVLLLYDVWCDCFVVLLTYCLKLFSVNSMCTRC